MKHFKIFIWKEFLHIWRDKKTLLIIILLPIIEVLLFGFVLTSEINHVSLGIYDQDNSDWSGELTRSFENSRYFDLIRLYNEQDVEKALRGNRVKAVLKIKPEAEKSLQMGESGIMQLLLDASDPNIARTIEVYIMNMSSRFMKQAGNRKNLLDVQQLMYYNPDLKSVFKSVPGLMAVVLMLICAMMTSVSLAREKETGTMDVLLISPLKPGQIIIGKMVPYIAISFVNILMIIALSVFVFGVPVRGSLVLLFLFSGFYVVCALSFGLLVSTLVNTQQIAMMISLAGLMLPTTLLSGLIYPIRNMPRWLQMLSGVFPARWFVETLGHVMLKDSPVYYFLQPLGYILLITVILLLLAARRFKVRYD
ncbi:MAG: ABC transporter permease [Candidatus Cloacimonetes bacterium]|nr:ABC transporter permease [Candidatus Cloacimonadota bacterium]